MARIIITGSSGFIASHIVDKYVELGHDVIAVDRIPPRYKNPKALYIERDLTADVDVSTFLESLGKVDIINHHAAQVDLRIGNTHPTYDVEQNVLVTVRLLDAAADLNVKRFIFASSAGAIGPHEFPESVYGISKLTCEKYIEFFKNFYELNPVILRYSNVYGPRQEKGFISILLNNSAHGNETYINGDGSQTRDFIHVDDVVIANVRALEAPMGRYTVASGASVSLNSVIHCVPDAIIKNDPPVVGEVQHSFCTPSIGWNSTISLQEGLKSTYQFYKDEYQVHRY